MAWSGAKRESVKLALATGDQNNSWYRTNLPNHRRKTMHRNVTQSKINF